MCLIAFALDAHPRHRLVLAGNRDEFYHRAADAAQWWHDRPTVLGGRDRQALGTWLGMTRDGRVAALTNVREGTPRARTGPSRGDLPRSFLDGAATPMDHAQMLTDNPDAPLADYAGFNLLMIDLFADMPRACCLSNRDAAPRPLESGVYGLSNHLMDTPWPKVERLKQAVRESCRADVSDDALEQKLFEALTDRAVADDALLPRTGVPLERERLLAPAFVSSADYGTRASTVLMADRNGQVRFIERTWDGADATARNYRERRFGFRISGR